MFGYFGMILQLWVTSECVKRGRWSHEIYWLKFRIHLYVVPRSDHDLCSVFFKFIPFKNGRFTRALRKKKTIDLYQRKRPPGIPTGNNASHILGLARNLKAASIQGVSSVDF